MALSQLSFRVRTDSNSASNGPFTWPVAINSNFNIALDVRFRIRFSVENNGAGATAFTSYPLYVSKNGGAYFPLSSFSPDVGGADATLGASSNGQGIATAQIGGSALTFSGVGVYTYTGAAPANLSIPASSYVEFEYGLRFNSPTPAGAYTFRIYQTTGTALDSYAHSPTFTYNPIASLAITEASDILTGAASIPDAAALAIIEADDDVYGVASALVAGALATVEDNDSLVGTSGLAATAALAKTEAGDTVSGAGAVIPFGGLTAILNTAEANDTVTGAGMIKGAIASLNIFEDDDVLAGSAYRPNPIPFDEWIPIPPPIGVWVESPPCGDGS